MKNDPLIKKVDAIAHEIYSIANTIENDFADEKWRTVIKLKNAAVDSYFDVANIAGAGKGKSSEYDSINAKKHLVSLKAMYIFANKEGMTKLDPQLVVNIDKLVELINLEMSASQDEAERKIEEELKPWLEKFRIWQKISKH